MSELTKCWLQQAITGIETIRDDMPFGLDEDEQKTLAALKMALSVLDAKPVGMFMLGIEDEPVPGRIRYSHMIGEDANSPFCFPLYTTLQQPVSKGYTLPDGWKLVPIEPNWSMLNAAINFHEGEAFLPASLYKAMLAAAPAPGGDQ